MTKSAMLFALIVSALALNGCATFWGAGDNGGAKTRAATAQPPVAAAEPKAPDNPMMTMFVFKGAGLNGSKSKPNGYRFSFYLFDEP